MSPMVLRVFGAFAYPSLEFVVNVQFTCTADMRDGVFLLRHGSWQKVLNMEEAIPMVVPEQFCFGLDVLNALLD